MATGGGDEENGLVKRIRVAALAACWLLVAGAGRANYFNDAYASSVPPFSDIDTLFPNWVQAPAAVFTLDDCDATICTWCTTDQIVGLTVLNYGTASGGGTGDIRGVYFDVVCGSKTNIAVQTMTWAGNWTIGVQSFPAWTWGGGPLVMSNVCDAPSWGCSCYPNIMTYVDIGPCPGDGNTVELGLGFNDTVNPAWPGGVFDSCGSAGNWGPTSDPAPKTIRYSMKSVNLDVAAPGDTLLYTIFYGKPSAGPVSNMWIIDTLPTFMHWVSGIGSVPDPGYDPDPGPPTRLRWTIPGPFTTAGGATGMIVFAATIDWGNGESFEPGSGDFAAQEGQFLFNSVHTSWEPAGGCPPGSTSNTVATVVKRYYFWLLGDQDILFAPRVGQSDDEIIYSLFVKNISSTRTWWNVHIWDTVPTQLDSWSQDQGIEDPCTGWTMTPSGCAAASPGKVVTGAKNTILTWQLDLPPGFTLTVRWKGKVRQSTTVGAVMIDQASILAWGQTGVVGGTGSAQNLRSFTHQAGVVLRTTFVSYVGWAGAESSWFKGCVNQTYFISFYPLNKACDFQLYKKWCCSAAPCEVVCSPFATAGGVSPKIDVFAGTCTGGPPIDWEMGCKVERAPSRYVPNEYVAGVWPALPFNYLHKMVSNAPMIWELSMCLAGGNQDANTYAGTTSLSFCGYIAYSYCRTHATDMTTVDTLYCVNTDDTQPTTIFIFAWNPALLAWEFAKTQDVWNGSQWDFVPTVANHYRVISSNTKLIVEKAWPGLGVGGAYNDMGSLAPNRENGGLVNFGNPATYYMFCGHLPGTSDVAAFQNLGAVALNYEVHRYAPLDPTAKSPNPKTVSTDLVGYSGTWTPTLCSGTVPAGFSGVANPEIYGDNYTTGCFAIRYRLYKVIFTTGKGQAYGGRAIVDQYSGGSMLHAADAATAGQQTGQQYWLYTNQAAHDAGGYSVSTIDVFCPKINLVLNLSSGAATGGIQASATYTTNDVDECVSFRAISNTTAPNTLNWKIQVLAAGNPGDVIGQYITMNVGEKFYTAPFLQRGIFYDILVPPTVFTGESFWITIVVVQGQTSQTKTDYCGTASFTSTDQTAKIGGTGMDAYNYTWHASMGGCAGVPNDNGVHIFVNVVLTRLGLQSIVAADTADGTITGLASIMVVGADVELTKSPRLVLAASADTVQFKVCWSNYSSASAFTFVITDAIPMGTTFVPEASVNAFNCGTTDGVAVTVAYSTQASAAPPPPASFTNGNPVAGTRWLRWTVPMAGVETSGCACYRIVIN
ncbi:MAG: hypothetical protein AAB152_18395 [Candidatus Coatesbacteria bacterium]